jgi:phospholipid/cholesterol/gamma-HCH transport system ATP-binding protein
MGQAPETFIEIENLHFAFGERQIFKGINLSIPRGKVVSILGVGGSGKSTLLRLIGGQLRPDQGCVKVDGRVVHEMGQRELYELRRDMGLMFQAGGLFSDLSVYDNIAFPIRELTSIPEELIHDLVMMKLHAVGLRGASGLMPNELSGGMSRRVALARAIVLDPQLAMYDEPFAGLDPISLNVIAQLIRRLNDALNVTSIVVTYDVSESLKIADYGYLIHDGVVQAEGTPDTLMTSAAPFETQFLHAQPNGPIPFHMESPPYPEDLGIDLASLKVGPGDTAFPRQDAARLYLMATPPNTPEESGGRTATMQKFLIANPKGGAGKSTLATNLAGWLAKSGLRVMLGDIDRQQSSLDWLSVRSPELPRIATWDIRPGEPARPPKDVTHIVLDTPGGLHGKKLDQVVCIVNHVIVPIQASLFDIYATRRFLEELLASRAQHNPSLRIALVGMRIDPRTRAASELERFLAATGLPIIAYLRSTQNYVQTTAHGMTIFDLTPAQGAHDWRQWEPLLQWIDGD